MPKHYGPKSIGGVGSRDVIDLAQKSSEKAEFIEWYATPESLRDPRTQKELADILGVQPNTITDWKKDPRVLSAVKGLQQKAVVGSLSDIIESLIEQATDVTNPRSVAASKILVEMADKGDKATDTVPLGDMSTDELKELVSGLYDEIGDRAESA